MSYRGDEDRSPSYYDGQDWTKVVIKGKKIAEAGPKTQIPKPSPYATQMRKLAESEEPAKTKRLAAASKQELIAKRLSNKWSQVQLNQECGFPANTIRDIESGRFCPTPSQLNTLNRVLKLGLRYD